MHMKKSYKIPKSKLYDKANFSKIKWLVILAAATSLSEKSYTDSDVYLVCVVHSFLLHDKY